MELTEVKEFFEVKKNTELAKILGKSKGLMTIWERNGIPDEAQAVIQIMSDNKLKSCIPVYQFPSKTKTLSGN